jgi:outer membrane lipoprotein-sorting protein
MRYITNKLARVAAVVCVVCVATGTPSFAHAANGAPTADEALAALSPELRALIEKVDATWSDAKDLRGSFTQSKHTPLLKKPLISQGQLLMAGGLIRWDTLKPSRTQTLIEADRVSIYDAELKRVEIYKFDPEKTGMPLMGKGGAGPMPRFADMVRQFDVTELKPVEGDATALVRLQFTPRDEGTREQMESMTFALDRENGHMRQMRIDHGDGEYTVYSFDKIELNQGLTAEDVKLKLPRGVEVVRPYGDEQQ